ncbi:MAG TPA: UDP-N-acetylmuramoyl-L-alanyl-D-glutamate--2,6-diaminopimelate ligase [Terriglobia bacterium]|nr:UDP-N-acetylmuramoyl-L-alanyl-D-glutamate--2,6-diaminopimelate ligase [Terriglobia bacterium]
MTLGGLVSGLGVAPEGESHDTAIRGIACDSRKVEPGFLFVAIRGMRQDGNQFVGRAIASGASAVVSATPRPAEVSIPWIQVSDERAALATIASRFYGNPSERLRLVGVTGTNGKTTTTYLVEAILNAAGSAAAVFGTIEYRGPGFRYSADRTTPEASDLQALLGRVADAGCPYAVMEVSSHAIALQRVAALRFDLAVFTNLSRDHLDLHGDMRSYFLEKKKLFTGLDGHPPRVSVLNRDDPHFAELAAIEPARVISYGFDPAADVRAGEYRFGSDGVEAVFDTPAGALDLRSAMSGRPNLYNIGAAIGVGLGLGLSLEAIRSGVENMRQVPGRFEAVSAGQDFRVIVDYAHTDDALEKALRSARELTPGRLIVVFGCGGDRDRTKRPLMGEAAARLADFAVVTADNPRSEDIADIMAEIRPGLERAGARPGERYVEIPDRREAIDHALCMARAGDTVLLAGKGHETQQTIGSRTFEFDDRAVARELLDELVAKRNR